MSNNKQDFRRAPEALTRVRKEFSEVGPSKTYHYDETGNLIRTSKKQRVRRAVFDFLIVSALLGTLFVISLLLMS